VFATPARAHSGPIVRFTHSLAHNPIDHLFFYAAYQPDAIAIESPNGRMSFGELHTRVRSVAAKLRAMGVDAGDIVVTHIADRAADWIVTLALMHEAAVSASVFGYLPLPPTLRAARVLSDRVLDPLAVAGACVTCLDSSWFDPVESPAVAPRDFPAADALLRLTLTSGTTGESRVVPGSVAHRVGRSAEQVAKIRWRHELSLMGLGSTGGYNCALQALLEGMPLYHAASPADAVELLHRSPIESLLGSPMQLAALLEPLRAGTRRPTRLSEITLAGASPSPRLLGELRAALCSRIELVYGSTEVGTVSRMLTHQPGLPDGAAGFLLPGVQAEVVDENRQPMPRGEEGHLRLRTRYMANAYFGGESSTAFHDGWFYPGDLAVVRDDGLLILRGRNSEIVNRGGVKVDPDRIDRAALTLDAVVDAAAFAFENADGVGDLALALVTLEGFSLEALQRALVEALGPSLLPSCYVTLPRIPRNAMGKVLRAQLGQELGTQAREATRPMTSKT
jgi:acyl-coenzyme A synthetase/AMP-(fatty) acid ligase